MIVQKKTGNTIQAWVLGDNSNKERELIAAGKIRVLPDGRYELFSQESKSGHGELAPSGYIFKVNSAGFPYPNEPEWFKTRHVLLSEDTYRQIPEKLQAYRLGDIKTQPLIDSLIDRGILNINENDSDNYYGAYLWGTYETSPSTSVIVFHDVDKDAFNFVAIEEFIKNYDIIVD